MLQSGKFYGFKAKEVFDECCEELGFNKSVANHFSYRQRLYSSNATPEGYGVWFIANSNWTKSKGGSWQNTIAGNYSFINEQWDKDPEQAKDCFDFEKRLVFAKSPLHSDGYIFLGVYEPVGFNNDTQVRRFERVSDSYSAA